MIHEKGHNIRMVIQVARRFGDLRKQVVFVGGCATGLLITDPAMPEPRITRDVDVIVEVSSRNEYYQLEEELRTKGFRQDMSEDAPLCRWLIDNIMVDFMPTEGHILGFTNRWYLPAIREAITIEIETNMLIQHVSPPYFLATKLEAFKGRGVGDYMTSHDIEDIITILDGRPHIVEEIKRSSDDVQNYLCETFKTLLADSEFLDAIPGHLMPDQASQSRLPLIIKRIRDIAGRDIL